MQMNRFESTVRVETSAHQILDEPAASLDPQGRHDVLEVMERLRKDTTIFYSTHILSDVQRVSDTMAILNHGQLIAQAPIDELLAGDQANVYLLTVKGDAAPVQARISSQPWVQSIHTVAVNDHMSWQIAVNDQAAAGVQLLRLALSDGVIVTEFGRKKADLEQVFLGLTEGGHHGEQ
jgi:ABC-2 type transport system ATP-binding protein